MTTKKVFIYDPWDGETKYNASTRSEISHFLPTPYEHSDLETALLTADPLISFSDHCKTITRLLPKAKVDVTLRSKVAYEGNKAAHKGTLSLVRHVPYVQLARSFNLHPEWKDSFLGKLTSLGWEEKAQEGIPLYYVVAACVQAVKEVKKLPSTFSLSSLKEAGLFIPGFNLFKDRTMSRKMAVSLYQAMARDCCAAGERIYAGLQPLLNQGKTYFSTLRACTARHAKITNDHFRSLKPIHKQELLKASDSYTRGDIEVLFEDYVRTNGEGESHFIKHLMYLMEPLEEGLYRKSRADSILDTLGQLSKSYTHLHPDNVASSLNVPLDQVRLGIHAGLNTRLAFNQPLVLDLNEAGTHPFYLVKKDQYDDFVALVQDAEEDTEGGMTLEQATSAFHDAGHTIPRNVIASFLGITRHKNQLFKRGSVKRNVSALRGYAYFPQIHPLQKRMKVNSIEMRTAIDEALLQGILKLPNKSATVYFIKEGQAPAFEDLIQAERAKRERSKEKILPPNRYFAQFTVPHVDVDHFHFSDPYPPVSSEEGVFHVGEISFPLPPGDPLSATLSGKELVALFTDVYHFQEHTQQRLFRERLGSTSHTQRALFYESFRYPQVYNLLKQFEGKVPVHPLLTHYQDDAHVPLEDVFASVHLSFATPIDNPFFTSSLIPHNQYWNCAFPLVAYDDLDLFRKELLALQPAHKQEKKVPPPPPKNGTVKRTSQFARALNQIAFDQLPEFAHSFVWEPGMAFKWRGSDTERFRKGVFAYVDAKRGRAGAVLGDHTEEFIVLSEQERKFKPGDTIPASHLHLFLPDKRVCDPHNLLEGDTFSSDDVEFVATEWLVNAPRVDVSDLEIFK